MMLARRDVLGCPHVDQLLVCGWLGSTPTQTGGFHQRRSLRSGELYVRYAIDGEWGGRWNFALAGFILNDVGRGQGSQDSQVRSQDAVTCVQTGTVGLQSSVVG